jgi:lipooligosaccharide transport system permease protein
LSGKPMKYYLVLPSLNKLSWTVWKRDRDVYLKTYKTNLIPPLLEPILYLLAFGFGLGVMMTTGFGDHVYIQFIAPAMIALTIMNAASFECTYGSFVRMYYQKTFDAITATPVSVENVIAGEMLWGASKSLINSGIMVGVMLIIGPLIHIQLLSWQFCALILLVAFLGGLLFAAIGMCFTAVVPQIDHFNYFIFLIVTPMMLLCGTFFPMENLPWQVQTVAQALPLTHVVVITRELAYGALSTASLVSLGFLLVTSVIFFIIAVNLMRKRLVK